MKYDLVKIHHWLLLSTFKSKWFEENIKLQLIQILSWLIYPDYRKQTSLLYLVRTNKILLVIILICIVWSSTFFTFGRLSTSEKEVIIKKNFVINSYLKGVDFKSLSSERRFIEYLAHSNYKIENYKNLQKLPDEIFFTIISEIKKYNIPPSLFFRLIDQESGYLFIRNKNSGANGYGQVMPETKKSILRIIGSTNDEKIDNIRISAFLLKQQFDYYNDLGLSDRDSWFKSLVDYNGGSPSLARENMLHFHSTLR